ncbi:MULTISPECIES: acyl-CoA dehydrogenase family protein [Bacillus]|uniref:Acyl-CoA dehydrogenase n=1 Tax=Bacillus glycinifermentans TaxID=1664069 RepID=A0AAJ4D2M3_9BACI|nr:MULTISPECIES: acyl-CoA dehydrogenase family protein [Bacillus]KKB73127.1 acyl-CoA dehydrogenase [Bacillus sp. TH008]MDU0071403.1 acyl-CoA dehydrogenase family protein [Bacillus sp. IG6]MED8019296.1 acyl-CoA dehydrogenase family protein [Bacillus glycinifermentans]QAT65520.1 acyl-CoA dehydrogenase [Bacillus glycinifermentans]WKB79529.1 acyl-CoA dehydrogenase family protein [Bacillus glycinifermentans]
MGKAELRWNDPFISYDVSAADVFTPEDFNEEEQLIAKTTELFVRNDVIPLLESIDQHHHENAKKLFQKAGELGLLGIEVPEEYGGLSLNKKLSGLVAEKMGAGGSFSVSFNIHAGVGTLPYIYYGTEEQKQKYLPKLASGEWIGAYALTEPNAGSDALNAKTTAVLNEEGTAWILNGEKQWITNAQVADVYVVFAKTNEGMTAFIVERSFKGVSIGPEEKKMGIKGSSTATLILEEVSIPAKNVLGTVGKGHHVALNILNMARLKLAFSNIGTSKQALNLSVNYAKQRKQFNRPIISFSMIQEKVADMAISIYGAESAAYRTADSLDNVFEPAVPLDERLKELANYASECAINKVNCSEILGRIVDEAVQIHGGYGYMQEYEVERLYRDARISRIFEGTNEINRLTIAKLLMKQAQQSIGTRFETQLSKQENRNRQFIDLSNRLLNKSLNALTHSTIDIQQEQEYSRLIADMKKEIYVMESAVIRAEKAVQKSGREKEQLKELMTNVICEDGFRRIEEMAVSVLAGIESNEAERKLVLEEIRSLPIPLYSNLFAQKREIAKRIAAHEKYMV